MERDVEMAEVYWIEDKRQKTKDKRQKSRDNSKEL